MSEQRRKTLRELREARQMTQFELAVASGVSLSTVANVEAGRQEPRVSMAEKLAQALGVSIVDIAWPEPEDLSDYRARRNARGQAEKER